MKYVHEIVNIVLRCLLVVLRVIVAGLDDHVKDFALSEKEYFVKG